MMGAKTHTPGPWSYGPSFGIYNQDMRPNGEYIITGSNEHGGSVLPILGRTHNWPSNAEANARLIAAAPDMLETLQRIAAATPSNTNSHTADSMSSWCRAVAACAVERAINGDQSK